MFDAKSFKRMDRRDSWDIPLTILGITLILGLVFIVALLILVP